MDEEYVQEHILTGGIVAPVEGGRCGQQSGAISKSCSSVKSGEEPPLPYNRVLLSSVLASEVRASDISLKQTAWWNAEVAAHAGIAGQSRHRRR